MTFCVAFVSRHWILQRMLSIHLDFCQITSPSRQYSPSELLKRRQSLGGVRVCAWVYDCEPYFVCACVCLCISRLWWTHCTITPKRVFMEKMITLERTELWWKSSHFNLHLAGLQLASLFMGNIGNLWNYTEYRVTESFHKDIMIFSGL